MRFVWFVLLSLPVLAAAQQVGTVSSQPGQSQQSNPSVQPTRPEDLCTIEGQAVNALTGEPLKKAQIAMNNLGGHTNATPGAITDATGRFVIENIDPGGYNVSADRNGFVRFQYGARGTGRPGTPLTLSPGQRTRDLVFRLVPQGVVTGKIVDEDGEPVESAQIRALRYAFVRGKRQMTSPGFASTDDQGEYRVFGLEPGKYYLSATYHPHNGMGIAQDQKPAAEANEGYAPTYYPGTNDPTAANAFQVSAGAVLSGVDITLRKTRTVQIRGHVVNPMGEGLPQFVIVKLMPKEGGFLNASTMGTVQRKDGAFQIRDVVPGSYFLTAQWQGESSRRMLRQPIEVGNSNLDNVSLVLTPALSLKGQVRVDGTAEVNLASISISLSAQTPMPMAGAYARATDDGTFTLDSVNADSYSILVRGLPPGFYVKSIRMGDMDALESGLDLTRSGPGVLDILVNPNGGEVDGAVMDPQAQFASGATVVLVPDVKRRDRSELFLRTATDSSGHFSLKGISPGEYKLFAWEDVENGAYQDPEFLQPFENQGETVTIREGSRENRQLKLIPAESTPKNAGS
jgi:protocatechuate 3,4-dioxygenase beta subunit